MNPVVLSTKKTTTAYVTTIIVTAVIGMLMGIISFCLYAFLKEDHDSPALIMILFAGVFLLVKGIIDLAVNVRGGQTYVEVYADRMIGKGLQNGHLLDFHIPFAGITNVSVEKNMWIYIHTNVGAYKIMTNKKTAADVFHYYHYYIQNGR